MTLTLREQVLDRAVRNYAKYSGCSPRTMIANTSVSWWRSGLASFIREEFTRLWQRRQLTYAETEEVLFRPLVDRTFAILRRRGLIPAEPVELLIARGADPYAHRTVAELLDERPR